MMGRRNVWILVLVLFVVMLGHGIVVPILPFYIESMGAGGTELGLLTASYAAMRLIFGPLWGGLSDRIGRKPVLLVGILGYVLSMVWFGLATQLWMLFAARILAGILSSATAPTTMAYIGDSTTEDSRGGGMGALGSAGGVGTILGPLFGGLLATRSLSLPFFLAAGLALLSLLLAALFLPESHAPETRQARRSFDWRRWGQPLVGPALPLYALTLIATAGLMIFASVFGLYWMERLSFGPEEIGVITMVMGLVSALAQGLVVGPLTKRWGESRVIQWSFVGSAISLTLLLLPRSLGWVAGITGLFALTASLQGPALLSLTSQRCDASQGVVMGLSNSFVSLGRIAGPLWGGVGYDHDARFPFVSGAVLLAAGYVVSRVWLGRRVDSRMPSESDAGG